MTLFEFVAISVSPCPITGEVSPKQKISLFPRFIAEK
jgi:hypothetical protein